MSPIKKYAKINSRNRAPNIIKVSYPVSGKI